MQVKEAIKKYIESSVRNKEVIQIIKVKHQIGKCILTIGSGRGSGTNSSYAIYMYTKKCRYGELVYHDNDPYRLAEYLIYFCGYEHLKDNLPLRQYK